MAHNRRRTAGQVAAQHADGAIAMGHLYRTNAAGTVAGIEQSVHGAGVVQPDALHTGAGLCPGKD